MSVSGRIKAPVKATLPTAARGTPKIPRAVSFKNVGSKHDDLDQDLMEINSNRSSAKLNSQAPPARFDQDPLDSLYQTKSPSVYEGLVSGHKSTVQEKANFRYQVPRSAKVESKKDPQREDAIFSPRQGTPKAETKASLIAPAKYQPDPSPIADLKQKNNFFKKSESKKLEVSGVDSSAKASEKAAEKINTKITPQPADNQNKKKAAYPGQFYADERLKKLRAEFLRKDMPIIDDNDFLRKEMTKGEEILEKNLAGIFEQHDENRGGGDHGPCYVPGQLLEKFPFPKKGTLKRDHTPIDFEQAKPIFGDANVPREAFNPKGLPQDLTTTYRVERSN
jgi:hypothetical protein